MEVSAPYVRPAAVSRWSDDARLPRASGAGQASVTGDALLALGMLLTTASQFRISGLPIGPGELCLLLWLLLMLVRELGRGGPPLTPALSKLLVFWGAFIFSEGLGFLTGLFLGTQYDPVWLLHDVMAYPLLVAVSCLSVVDPGAKARLRRVCWLLVTFGAVSLSIQAAAGVGILPIPGFEPWFWERFRGWSDNPNQLSLLCAVLGLLSLHLADSSARPGGRILAIVCAIPAVCVGRMTGSDTFTLALVASGPIYIGLKLQSSLFILRSRLAVRSAFAWIIVLALPLLLVSLAPLVAVMSADAGLLVKGMAKGGGKDIGQESTLRFTLWTQALELGIKSAGLGLGPGPHLEIPASIVEARSKTHDAPDNLVHPQQTSAPNFEAHNSFLDLLTQGGVIAVLSFTWILTVSGLLAYKTRRAGLLTVICGLVIYCMTGLIIRHPLVWFSITLCLVAQDERERVVAART